MQYLHTMIRFSNLEESLTLFEMLTLNEVRRRDSEGPVSPNCTWRQGTTSKSQNRPPRDTHTAFICTPDDISVERLQKGERLVPQ